jgi:type I restriction enzyme S subunit
MIGAEWIRTRLPNGWKIARIRDHVEITNGFPFDSKLFSASEGMPLVRIRDIFSDTAEIFYSGEPVAEALIGSGDILVGMDGDFNVAMWRGGEALLNQRVCRLEPKETVDGQFLLYLLPAPLRLINEFTYSTTVKHLSSFDIQKIHFPFPDMGVQRVISTYLDRETADIDTLIAAKQRLLDLLAEKRRAIVAEAIMRGLNPAAPLRPSGIDWLGDIPAHWAVRRVATLFTQRDERSQPELPLLEVSINSGVIVREFSNDKIEGTASDFNTYKVARRGDIAFNKMRMWQGAVGVAPVDGLVSPDYTVAEAASCLRPEYAGLLFRTDSFSAECGRNSQGITWDRLRLYWDGFRDIFMPLPPLAEQDAILEAVQAETAKIDRLRVATEHSIALLKERRGALIAAAVTGQIDIPEAA